MNAHSLKFAATEAVQAVEIVSGLTQSVESERWDPSPHEDALDLLNEVWKDLGPHENSRVRECAAVVSRSRIALDSLSSLVLGPLPELTELCRGEYIEQASRWLETHGENLLHVASELERISVHGTISNLPSDLSQGQEYQSATSNRVPAPVAKLVPSRDLDKAILSLFEKAKLHTSVDALASKELKNLLANAGMPVGDDEFKLAIKRVRNDGLVDAIGKAPRLKYHLSDSGKGVAEYVVQNS